MNTFNKANGSVSGKSTPRGKNNLSQCRYVVCNIAKIVSGTVGSSGEYTIAPMRSSFSRFVWRPTTSEVCVKIDDNGNANTPAPETQQSKTYAGSECPSRAPNLSYLL